MPTIEAIETFDELNKFPLLGYSSSYSYKVTIEESESTFGITLNKYFREKPFVKRWDPFLEDRIRLERIIKEKLSFAIYDSIKMIGIAVLEFSEWNNQLKIDQIEVIPEYQKRGIGAILIKEIKRIATEKYARKISLETQTSNGNAIDFYKKMGFRIEGIDISYYSNSDMEKEEIAVFMKMDI